MDEFTYTDQPELHEREEYQRVLTEVTHLLDDPQVVALYRTGSIRAPGLSDIDLIIILKDELNAPKRIVKKIARYRKAFPFFFIHEPVIVPESQAQSLKTIYPLFDFQRLSGKDFDLKGEFNVENSCVHLLNEFTVGLYSPALEMVVGEPTGWQTRLKKQPRKQVRVRHTLGRLSSLKYATFLYRKITGKTLNGANAFQKRVDTLRAEWFGREENKRTAELHALAQDYLKLCVQMADKFRDFLVKNNIANVNGIKHAKLLLPPRIQYYTADFASSTCLDKTNAVLTQRGELVSVLPLEFLAQPLCIPATRHFLDPATKKAIDNGPLLWSFKFKRTLSNMQESICRIQEFISKHHLPGKQFSKLAVRGTTDKLKRLIVSKIGGRL